MRKYVTGCLLVLLICTVFSCEKTEPTIDWDSTFSCAGAVQTDAGKVYYTCNSVSNGRTLALLLLAEEFPATVHTPGSDASYGTPFVVSAPGMDDYKAPPGSIVYYDGSECHLLAENRRFSCGNLDRILDTAGELYARRQRKSADKDDKP